MTTSTDSDNSPTSPDDGAEGVKRTPLESIAESIQTTTDLLVGVIEQSEQRIKNENTWSTFKRSFIVCALIVASLGYAALYGPMVGFRSGPKEPSVAVIRVAGPIGGMHTSNADTLVPLIRRVCADSNVSGLVMRISSPGGSPTDAERIGSSVAECRGEGKRVVAVIEGMGASAAYMVALEADSIWSNRYGLVGSIGAVMRTMDASELAGRVGLAERVYASGEQKGAGGLLTRSTKAQAESSQGLVDEVGEMFKADVRSRRGDRLKETPDMWSGRTWMAGEAHAIGLIDGVGVFEDIYESEFGEAVKYEVAVRQTLQERLSLEDMLKRVGVHVVSGLSETRIE